MIQFSSRPRPRAALAVVPLIAQLTPLGRRPLPSPAGANEPPRWTAAEQVSVKAKEHLDHVFRAEDPEGEPLTYVVEGLPVGSKAEAREGGVVVEWTPGDADVGTYEIALRATDPHGLTAERKVKLVVEEHVDDFVMPGAEFALYVPNDELAGPKLGPFVGASAQFCAWCWVHRTEKRGPSHGKLYLAFDVLAPTERTSSALFMATAGVGLSLERNPSRRWLVPYFGFDIGIYFQKQTETLAIVLPYGGLHLWSSGAMDVVLRAGYLLPFSSGRFDQVRGLRASVGVSVAFW